MVGADAPAAAGGLCLVGGGAAGASNAACPGAASSTDTSCTYTYTGGLQTFTVPADVSSVDVVAVGAAGGGYSGVLTGGGSPLIVAAFTVDSDSQITATAPAHSAGVVQVRVHTIGLSMRNPGSRYEYSA